MEQRHEVRRCLERVAETGDVSVEDILEHFQKCYRNGCGPIGVQLSTSPL
jgi:hypothetical protein